MISLKTPLFGLSLLVHVASPLSIIWNSFSAGLDCDEGSKVASTLIQNTTSNNY
jgi:preprotein translocase subunit SecF